MCTQVEKETVPFKRTVTNWHSARLVFSAFIKAHPELGLRDTPATFRNFSFRHGPLLRELDVMRKPCGLRSTAIFDVNRFDEVVFDLLSLRSNPNQRPMQLTQPELPFPEFDQENKES
jgi:hypothetical protein